MGWGGLPSGVLLLRVSGKKSTFLNPNRAELWSKFGQKLAKNWSKRALRDFCGVSAGLFAGFPSVFAGFHAGFIIYVNV
jgi:hypothetical protein